MSYFWPLQRLLSVQKMVASGRVVLHLKLKNVLLQAIVLECKALRLILRAFCTDACYIYCALTLRLFGKVEEGRLNGSLLFECANFLGNLFTVMSSHVSVVTSTNEANLKSKS